MEVQLIGEIQRLLQNQYIHCHWTHIFCQMNSSPTLMLLFLKVPVQWYPFIYG
jgi:hypothetical protein